MSQYHVPVLLNESVSALNIEENPNGIFIDVTFGGYEFGLVGSV